jgi:hypothetical protein
MKKIIKNLILGFILTILFIGVVALIGVIITFIVEHFNVLTILIALIVIMFIIAKKLGLK